MPTRKPFPYPASIERQMRALFATLSEKDRRRYAAIEAKKLPHGGVTYVSELLGISRVTIDKGMKELERLPEDEAEGRTRRPGGGRKCREVEQPEVIDEVNDAVEDYTGGDPMRPNIRFTNLGFRAIAERISCQISPPVVKRILEDGLHFVKRKMAKVLPGGTNKHRNAQFENIARIKNRFLSEGNPVFSFDTKKKEALGALFRAGETYCDGQLKVFDHDFPSWSDGTVIPHGIYDLRTNHGHINIGLSHDTSEFACDSLEWYWENVGRVEYAKAQEILLLCDGGGSDSSRHYIFKEDLQHLVDRLGVRIRVAHYPPYCSKYNPIERRFFSHVTRSCKGIIFDFLSTVVETMSRASTRTGLTTSVHVLPGIYETGRKYAENFKETMTIAFDSLLPQWNYVVSPSG